MRYLIMCISLVMAPTFATVIGLPELDIVHYGDWEFVTHDNHGEVYHYAVTTTRDRSLFSPEGQLMVGDKELAVHCFPGRRLKVAYRPSFIKSIGRLRLSDEYVALYGIMNVVGTIEYWVDSNPRHSLEWSFGTDSFHLFDEEHVAAVIDELKAGGKITMVMGDNRDQFSLKGAAPAIDRVLAMCSEEE